MFRGVTRLLASRPAASGLDPKTFPSSRNLISCLLATMGKSFLRVILCVLGCDRHVSLGLATVEHEYQSGGHRVLGSYG
jgi:hypothetical protein